MVHSYSMMMCSFLERLLLLFTQKIVFFKKIGFSEL